LRWRKLKPVKTTIKAASFSARDVVCLMAMRMIPGNGLESRATELPNVPDEH